MLCKSSVGRGAPQRIKLLCGFLVEPLDFPDPPPPPHLLCALEITWYSVCGPGTSETIPPGLGADAGPHLHSGASWYHHPQWARLTAGPWSQPRAHITKRPTVTARPAMQTWGYPDGQLHRCLAWCDSLFWPSSSRAETLRWIRFPA